MNSGTQQLQRSNPLTLTAGRFTHWLTDVQHMTRSLSLLRIIYGIALLSFLIPSFVDRSYLWGAASKWVNPEAKRRGFLTYDILFPKDNPFVFDVAYVMLILLAVVFILGWRTRIVLPVLLVLMVSLQANNPYLLNGGDTLMRITMSFLLFANLSKHFSLDAMRRRKKQQTNLSRQALRKESKAWIPAHVSNAAHNTGLVLACFQILLVYVTSGVLKLAGTEWLDGTAFYYALTIDGFALYPLVNELIWQSSAVVHFATWVALWVQLLFPLLLLWRPSRVISVILMVLMHLGIALLLSLWAFSLAMIALDFLFIRNEAWERLSLGVRKFGFRVKQTFSRPC